MRLDKCAWWGVWLVILFIGGPGLVSAQEDDLPPVFPDTTHGIHVFNDQIDVHHLSNAQAEFAATHYAGTQKLTLSGAQRLRTHNPDLVVLHYRLGLGLGYRRADANCQPAGDYLEIIQGNEWVREWPGDRVIPEEWLYHYGGQRAYWCPWGWYLANTAHPGWRAWWIEQVKTQLAANQANGLFADSVTVPNFLGAAYWSPALPSYDEAFEQDWTQRIDDWLAWANDELGEEYALIVNAGQLVTTREQTNYSLADGVMIEGFAGWGAYDRFALSDWQLQLNRALDLINRDRVVILQSYVGDLSERLWTLANYLLIKGAHTYVNLEVSQDVEWFPEYDLPVGTPLQPPPVSIDDLQNDTGLYVREYSNGLVVVNPDPDGAHRTLALDQAMHLVTDAFGGGDVPEDADLSNWRIITTEVTQVSLAPGQAALLLRQPASVSPQTGQQTSANAQTPTPEDETQISLSEVSAFHRDGQTFLVWPEVSGDLQMTYFIYRHQEPITLDNTAQAHQLAEIPQGSSIYWTERARAIDPPWADHEYASLRNYVISDRGEQLPDANGLFVWTAQEDGDFYYAVTTAAGNFLGAVGPITEQVSPQKPILAWESENGLSRVYTQFMDYASYNPTFDAPRRSNHWLNLPNWTALENMAPQQQYAYNYWVGLPTSELCEGPIPDPLPLVLHIEGWGSRYAAPADSLYFCAVHLWADDPNQSWYFGFSATHNYHEAATAARGPIANFTEARLLRAVREVIDDPALPTIDVNRIYAYGHSMGGTGALMLGERYPDIFAAIFANQPMMNFAAATSWFRELENKWGPKYQNFPVDIRGPQAGHLAPYQGTGVWDWQHLGKQLADRRRDDMALITITHGTQDRVIDWDIVVQPTYAYFYEGNRAFIALITADDHTWTNFIEHPNYWMAIRSDESLPALTNASGSASMPPESPGHYNLSLEWSSMGNDFAGPPVDRPDEWTIVLRSLAGEQTVDVTPRRLQRFEVEPGMTYTWQNHDLDENTLLQEGTVTADADGLITVPLVLVDETGNRLTIRTQ